MACFPSRPDVKKILVVGPLAESVEVLHGNYSGTASHAVTALEGIRKQFAEQPRFLSFPGPTSCASRGCDSHLGAFHRRWEARA